MELPRRARQRKGACGGWRRGKGAGGGGHPGRIGLNGSSASALTDDQSIAGTTLRIDGDVIKTLLADVRRVAVTARLTGDAVAGTGLHEDREVAVTVLREIHTVVLAILREISAVRVTGLHHSRGIAEVRVSRLTRRGEQGKRKNDCGEGDRAQRGSECKTHDEPLSS